MKATCIFWNLYKSPTTLEPLTEIVEEKDIDIIFLCEFPQSMEQQFEDSLRQVDPQFHIVNYIKPNTKFRIYSRFTVSELYYIYEEEKFSVLEFKNELVLLMCVCHLSSPMFADDNDKRNEAINLSNRLKAIERERDNTNLIIVGDFNEDPYHDGMLNCYGFNAVKELDLALRMSRNREGVDYPYFYNPMWSLWEKKKDIGTYYYYPTHTKSESWHIFDQVLIRPQLIEYFVKDKLQIITSSSYTSLVSSNGCVDKQYSDHLPICFELQK